ncbi:MAG: inositol monophosphatase family protein [Polyangiales bacterium]
MPDDWQYALEVAERAAFDAGKLIMEGFRSSGRVSRKGRFDLVTEFDFASERLIRERLGAAFPDHRIVGEEGEATGGGDLVWYVDPIDGTVNFAHGHPYFGVSIGLYREAEGLVGVVHAPALGSTWKAAKGAGAFRDGSPCVVSQRSTLDEALCATGFPPNVASTRDTNEAELGAFVRRARGVRRCGSAAIDLALVGDGTFDLYWERALNPWDICAGALIVAEAGGTVSSYDGSPADPRSGALVASNGLLHERALGLIQDARREALG